jgi:hypothetical protein
MSVVISTDPAETVHVPMHIHISDVRTFRSCRQRWYFSSPMQKGLTTRVPGRALFLGTICHDSLDRFHMVAGELPQERRVAYMEQCLNETFQSEIARLRKLLTQDEMDALALEITDLFDKAEGILLNHVRWCEGHFFPRFETLETEVDFVVPLMPERSISFAGRYDALLRHKATGRLWLLDYKVSNMPIEYYSQYLQQLDDQAKAYVTYCRQIYGQELEGIVFNVLRAKPPSQPRVLKSGEMSRAQNQDTTWEVYRQALTRAGLRPQDYLDVKAQLEEREARRPFNTMVMITFTDETLRLFERSMQQTVREMLKPSIYPNPNFLNCRMCAFQDPCNVAMLHGLESSTVNRALAEKFVKGRYVQDALELLESSSTHE